MACAYKECDNSKKKKIPGITFHKFPSDKTRRNAWTNAIGRKNWTPSKFTVVCSKHFKDSDFYRFSPFKTSLNSDAIPIPTNESSTAVSCKRQKLSTTSTEAHTINDSLVKSSQDMNTLQAVSSTSLDTNTIKKNSSSVDIYNESFMNLIEKAPTITKDSCVNEGTLPVTVSSHNTNSGPIVLAVVSNNNVFLEKTKKISEPVANSNAIQMETNFSHQAYVQGRRIINFEYFLHKLKKVNQHSKWLQSGCNLNDIIITKEVKFDLCSYYHLKCQVCNFQSIMCSEVPHKLKNINTDTVDGMLSINCSLSDINKLLCKMDLPTLSNEVYVHECSQILSNEIKRKTKIMEQNSNFTAIDEKITKESRRSSVSLPVTVSSHNTNSGPIVLAVVSNNNVFLEKTKEISEPTANAIQMKTNFLRQAYVQGRRIINFEYFLHKLKKFNQHSKSGCNLNDIIITKEVKFDLCSCYHLKCRVCCFQDLIHSEVPHKLKNINTDTVDGMLSINCSLSDINKLLCKMDLPTLSNEVYVQECSQILSDEIKSNTKIIDQNSNFTAIDEKISKESRKSSASNLPINAHQAFTLPKKPSKIILNNHTQEQTQTFKSAEDQESTLSNKFIPSNSSLNNNTQEQTPKPIVDQVHASSNKSIHSDFSLNYHTQEQTPKLNADQVSTSSNKSIHSDSSSNNHTQEQTPKSNADQVSTSSNKIIHSNSLLNNRTQEQMSKSIAYQVSASSNENCEQLDCSGLIVKDEIEIEVSDSNFANETGVTLLQDVQLKTSDDTLGIDEEPVTLIIANIKKEIDSDRYSAELTEL